MLISGFATCTTSAFDSVNNRLPLRSLKLNDAEKSAMVHGLRMLQTSKDNSHLVPSSAAIANQTLHELMKVIIVLGGEHKSPKRK
ncbi:hypothetical protein CYMTET_53002 [Cymbomonas tetramitiformis]|uniref:Uncharacterized protein n=1 Tax=Cymbomonas tetramitiformis TaxID=36881 RepID=A0AAE0ER19_9CHLO|nr:hypothetical protein CYMTET_53002 [Cymbomonas tetramitiformis]